MTEEVTVTKLEGVLSYVDSKGNVTEMYPEIKTDTTLSESDKAADAKVVGDKLKKALYVDSFDAKTGVLNTVSDK